MTLAVLVPGSLDSRTGGSIYDRRIVEGLRAAGHAPGVHECPGAWPRPSAAERASLAAVLAGLPDGATAVIDGLILGAAPEEAAAEAGRLALVALVHHPLCDESGLDAAEAARLFESERAALAAAGRIIVTSAFTRRRLADFGCAAERVAVVEPGTDPVADVPVREETDAPLRLLCAASLIPRKGHDVLFRALHALRDRDWHLVCVGKADLDTAHAARLDALRRELGLDARIEMRGEVDEAALRTLYRDSDLFVLASHYEGYGMAVTEAVAHGLPVVTTTGGALADTLPAGAGIAVAPGAIDALRDALARVMDSAQCRSDLRRGAGRARAALPDWDGQARAFARALGLEGSIG